MFKLEIDGLDEVTRDLDEIEQAISELGTEIELRFTPGDVRSVEAAITDMKTAVDRKFAPFIENDLIESLAEQLKAEFEQEILAQASEAMQKNTDSPGETPEPQTLRGIENAVNDLRRADHNGFDRHIRKLSRLLHTDGLDAISSELKSKVDIAAWIKAGETTQGSMVGSGQLKWPDDHESELGIVVALTDGFAEREGDHHIDPVSFSFDYFYSGNHISANLQSMVSEIYIPFARDFVEFVRARTGAREVTLLPPPKAGPASRKVFVVHGHDDGAREATARFLEKLGFEPIILHEQASQGRTVIEKIEEHGDVGFAVVLLTPDDVGAPRGKEDQLKPRARQNVLLELGYFVGRLGRSHVVALKRGDIEIPSDFEGIVYVPYDSGNGWKQDLGKELSAAGYQFDWNVVMAAR